MLGEGGGKREKEENNRLKEVKSLSKIVVNCYEAFS